MVARDVETSCGNNRVVNLLNGTRVYESLVILGDAC